MSGKLEPESVEVEQNGTLVEALLSKKSLFIDPKTAAQFQGCDFQGIWQSFSEIFLYKTGANHVRSQMANA